jgi:hypothetical protein
VDANEVYLGFTSMGIDMNKREVNQIISNFWFNFGWYRFLIWAFRKKTLEVETRTSIFSIV